MDFFKIREKNVRKNVCEIYPDFCVGKTKDLMVRGKSFYAIWDEEKNLWSTDEYDVQRLVDKELEEYYKKRSKEYDGKCEVRYMSSFSSRAWKEFKEFVKNLGDNYKQLDTEVIFANTEVSRTTYASMKLPYEFKKGRMTAYNKLMSVLYLPEERQKIEWAIGSIIRGDSKNIQKFIVFFGDPGTGKSTVMDIIEEMFNGYCGDFDAETLTSRGSSFATEDFKSNPLIAIQHDGDLSKIDSNTRLNTIVSHEKIIINEKFKSKYSMRLNSFLIMGTNKPVKITDGKAGIIRRLIDIRPTGNKIEENEYFDLIEKVRDELGAIAYHCAEVYDELGKNYYSKYKPVDMMYKTDIFYNFVESYMEEFKRADGVTLKQAYAMYKKFCEDGSYEHKMMLHAFREELKNYFNEFKDRDYIDGVQVRSYYSGFKVEKFDRKMEKTETVKKKSWLDLTEHLRSRFDDDCFDCPAQYANEKEDPSWKWINVKTTIADLDTHKLHYAKVPINHIVVDFDLKGKDGKKSLERNIEAAKKFPKTYAETSKSGEGLHLHYIYRGDPERLSRVYDDNIEVKVFTGNSSLRRKLVKCNDIPIATLDEGFLPLKEEGGKGVVDFEVIKSEKLLRTMIKKNLNKEYHKFTKPSVDFINHLLDQAYNSGMKYDLSDMRNAVLIFASQSHNQADACIKLVNQMKFKSDDPSDAVSNDERPMVFYDVEVYPNLFVIVYKKPGDDNFPVVMINPTPNEVEELIKFRLVGFNCRRYDNHILYARMMNYTNFQLFNLSQRIVSCKKGETKEGCFFGEAYNISYTDIYDYAVKKQSLKKWEIELADKWNEEHPLMPIRHHEMGLKWDMPVPESMWEEVADYCKDDVYATEAVWNATQADFTAREVLVSICKHAGMNACVNDTTNSLTTKIIFGNDRHPELVYTHLDTGEQE